MKSTTTAIAALCSLLFVGCNALNRVGSQSVVFDSDPFTQIDNAQADDNQVNRAGYNQAANGQQQYAQQPQGQPNHAAMMAQSQTPQTGRVSVGNLGGAVPPTYNNLPQTASPVTPAPTAQAQYTYNPTTAAAPPVMNQPGYAARPASPASQATTGPAARAAAEAAAMMAARTPQQQQQPIHQMSYETAAPVQPGDFEPNPFGGAVPMPPEAQYNVATDEYELSDADLAIPDVEQKQGPRMFPGYNIPMPVGRVTIPDVMPSEWETAPTPTPAPVSAPIEAQPVFSPPARQPVLVSEPAAIPSESVKATPVIKDSTDQSKWRAVRRM